MAFSCVNLKSPPVYPDYDRAQADSLILLRMEAVNHAPDAFFLVILQIAVFRNQFFLLLGQRCRDAPIALGGGGLVGCKAFQCGMEVFGQLEHHLNVWPLGGDIVEIDPFCLRLLLHALRGGLIVQRAQGGDDPGNRGLAKFLFTQDRGLGDVGGTAGAERLNHQLQCLVGEAEFRADQIAADEVFHIGAVDLLFLPLVQPVQLGLNPGKTLVVILLGGYKVKQERNQRHNADQR